MLTNNEGDCKGEFWGGGVIGGWPQKGAYGAKVGGMIWEKLLF
jgi:hypothetical protein